MCPRRGRQIDLQRRAEERCTRVVYGITSIAHCSKADKRFDAVTIVGRKLGGMPMRALMGTRCARGNNAFDASKGSRLISTRSLAGIRIDNEETRLHARRSEKFRGDISEAGEAEIVTSI